MMNLLKYLDARLSEPSTYAGMSAMLIAANINIDPGIWHMITLWGGVASGVLATILAEVGTASPSQLAGDAVNALVAAVQAMPAAAPPPPPPPAAPPPPVPAP